MRRVFRLVLVLALAAWVWRSLVAERRPRGRAAVAYADGSSLVLEPGAAAFERLAAPARRALAS